MKRLINILLIMALGLAFIPARSGVSGVNTLDTIPYNPLLSSYGYTTARMIMRNGLVVPVGDTTFGTDTSRVGAVVYNPTDSTFYIWNGYWFSIKGGGESVNLGNSDLTNTSETQIRTYNINDGGIDFLRNPTTSPQLSLYPTYSNLNYVESGSSYLSQLGVGSEYVDLYTTNGTIEQHAGLDPLGFHILNQSDNSDTITYFYGTGDVRLEKYAASSGDTLAAGFNDKGQLITFNRSTGGTGSFINNQTTEQAGANFNIGGNGITQGNLTVNGPNMWANNYTTDETGTGANVARFSSTATITNSAQTNWPTEGVDIHGGQNGLIIQNSANIANNAQNNISGMRGTIYVNGSGTGVTATATGNPYAGVSAVAAAFNNSNYTDVAGLSVSYPFTFTQGSYTSFTGTITNFYQLYLQGTVTQNIDDHITNKWGLYQASTYPNKLSGGISMPITTTAAGYTVTTSNYTVISTSGSDVIFTMPDPTTCTGSIFKLVAGGAGGISLSVSYTNYAGSTVGTVTTGTAVTIQSDGTIFRQIP